MRFKRGEGCFHTGDQGGCQTVLYNAAMNPEHEALITLANTKMPFGKYAGRYLVDLPETYVLWFKGKGYPQGPLGDQLREIEVIKVNGLEGLLRPLIRP